MALWQWNPNQYERKETSEHIATVNEEILCFPVECLERFDETQLERIAIMTIDGGLSDEDAVKQLEGK